MSQMVERVARSLAARCGVDPDDMNGGTWDGGSYSRGKPAWTVWQDDARAAIETMREAADDQRAAYYKLSGNIDVMMDAHWERAIDAALV